MLAVCFPGTSIDPLSEEKGEGRVSEWEGSLSKQGDRGERLTCVEILLFEEVEVVSSPLWRDAVVFSNWARGRASLGS